jgi:hypothetical protein
MRRTQPGRGVGGGVEVVLNCYICNTVAFVVILSSSNV